ncbi:ATP-binding protein [Actinomadura fibrosa]|uniref:ATP-binding protein n=1 Tax=Actinomadura fibrosa TaxID=111802 RepID=A0ABW2XSL3_9ACTN|nr:ATP-binding protein [Actinomadura fibrosa]
MVVVPVRAEAIKMARDWLGEVLGGWGQDAYIAKLAVSELVTNVLKHTDCGTATVRVVRGSGGTVVEVFDASAVLPVAGNGDLLDEGGRGLAMVGALVKDWGAEPRDGGKVVWVLLPGDGSGAAV